MITNTRKKFLRSLLHHKGIVIWIGQKGLTDNVSKEIEEALDHHELIKVRIRSGDRETRDELVDKICRTHRAELVQKTGNVVAIFREHPETPRIRLPR